MEPCQYGWMTDEPISEGVQAVIRWHDRFVKDQRAASACQTVPDDRLGHVAGFCPQGFGNGDCRDHAVLCRQRFWLVMEQRMVALTESDPRGRGHPSIGWDEVDQDLGGEGKAPKGYDIITDGTHVSRLLAEKALVPAAVTGFHLVAGYLDDLYLVLGFRTEPEHFGQELARQVREVSPRPGAKYHAE